MIELESNTIQMGGMSEETIEPEFVRCDKCKGKGRIFVSFICDPETIQCNTCNGNGKIKNPRFNHGGECD